MSLHKAPQPIGWVEKAELSFVGADRKRIRISTRAKIDTGAESSVLSAHAIRRFRHAGKRYIEFRTPKSGERKITARYLGKKKVRSSDGRISQRVAVKGHLRIGKRAVTVSLALTDRSEMKVPVLVGRNTLKNRFIVDCRKRFLLRRNNTKKTQSTAIKKPSG